MKTVKKWGVALAVAALGASVTMPAAAQETARGEVRKIDAGAGKITLKHGAIPGLELPATTLVYLVASPDLLKDVKPGDTVQFTAQRVNGQYTVTAIGK